MKSTYYNYIYIKWRNAFLKNWKFSLEAIVEECLDLHCKFNSLSFVIIKRTDNM